MRLTARDLLGELGEHEVGNREAEGPADLARRQLGDERLLAVAGAAELDDVLAAVIGLHEGR